jgi:hypothetical protein
VPDECEFDHRLTGPGFSPKIYSSFGTLSDETKIRFKISMTIAENQSHKYEVTVRRWGDSEECGVVAS